VQFELDAQCTGSQHSLFELEAPVYW